jgi:hypothetical protein
VWRLAPEEITVGAGGNKTQLLAFRFFGDTDAEFSGKLTYLRFGQLAKGKDAMPELVLV